MREFWVKKLVSRLLRSRGYTISRVVPPTTLVCQHIPGWFSVQEAEELYRLAATLSCPRMLEVGHFLGRSTSALCEGIKVAGRKVEFNSYDLGFTDAEQFVAHYKKLYNTTTFSVPQEYQDLVYSKKKTTTEIARSFLERFHLSEYVNLISGDFSKLDQTKYGFIFCDALHDLTEIQHILPHVINNSEDDCVWACHDMTDENVAAVLAGSPARLIRVVDTLGLFRFRR